jgi:hypothetical protein
MPDSDLQLTAVPLSYAATTEVRGVSENKFIKILILLV